MNKIRKLTLLTACFSTALISAANAVPAGFSGWYLGIDMGSIQNNPSYSTNPNCAPFGSGGVFCDQDTPGSQANGIAVGAAGSGQLFSDSLTWGIDGGHNWQLGYILLGAEGDINTINFNNSKEVTGLFPFTFLGDRYLLTESIGSNWSATLRGRIGVVVKTRFLFYGTGGAAFTSYQATSSYNDNAIGIGFPGGSGYGNISSSQTGWVLGAGGEFLLPHNFSIKLEYLHMNFGSMNFSVPISNTANFNQLMRVRFTLEANVMRLGINYLFA